MKKRASSVIARAIGSIFLKLFILTTAVAVLPTSAAAQIEFPAFDGFSGAEFAVDSTDLDVGYVPTPLNVVNLILTMGKAGPNDYLIDLGSGDGRIVIVAAKKYGARGLGVDLNAKLVDLSKKYARDNGVSSRTDFVVQNIFATDISRADIITMFLLPDVNLKLRPKLIKELKAGTRVVSYNYHMGDWRPDKTAFIEKLTPDDDAIVYLWIVPAKVAGNWYWRMDLGIESHEFSLQLKQHFQDISGAAKNRDRRWPLLNPILKGNQISFSLVSEAGGRMIRQDYSGIVNQQKITGTLRLSGATTESRMSWTATRRMQGVGLKQRDP
jgi:hypothetical protein